MSAAEMLREIRLKTRLSQAKLAELLGTSLVSVNGWIDRSALLWSNACQDVTIVAGSDEHKTAPKVFAGLYYAAAARGT